MARGKKKGSALTSEEKLAQALVPDWEQPYKVPKNWCWARIGAISDFERGITFPASAKENEPTEENIPCLRTANVQENLEIDDLIYVNQSFMKGNEAKLVRENDIIMSSANSRELVGKASFVTHVPFPMTFGGFVLNIRARGISSKYLFYFLRQEFLAGKFMGESTQTTNIANINTTTLGSYELPLPPLAEQQRIVDRIEYLFTKLDEAKEKAQSVLDSFETRKAAILHKAFTGNLTSKWRAEHNVVLRSWEQVLYSEIGTSKLGKMLDKAKNVGVSTPYLRNVNVRWFSFDLSDIYFMPASTAEIESLSVKPGDLFICEGGEPGRCAVWKEPNSELIFQKALHRFRPNGKVISEFLCYNLYYMSLNGVLEQYFTGTTIKHLTGQSLAKIPLSLPSITEQAEIVRILDSLFDKEQQAKDAAEAVLEKIDLLKKSILARAFRGELGTNDPLEESAIELIKQILSEKIVVTEPKKPRKIKTPEVDFVAKTIMQALASGEKLTPEKLKAETDLQIDDFYDQLKVLIDNGQVVETRVDGEAYLEANNADRQPNN